MLIQEIRIVLPLSVREFHIGQIHAKCRFRKNSKTKAVVRITESSCYFPEGSSGSYASLPQSTPSSSAATAAAVAANENKTAAQQQQQSSQQGRAKCLYTHHTSTFPAFLPVWAQTLLGTANLTLESKCWNEYPNIITTYEVPKLRGKVSIIAETRHFDNDKGSQENVFQLSPAALAKRKVVHLDISDNINTEADDYSAEEDPRRFRSKKTARGPFPKGWARTYPSSPSPSPFALSSSSSSSAGAAAAAAGAVSSSASQEQQPQQPQPQQQRPYMCVYLLVRTEVKIFGLQTRAEAFIAQKLQDALLHIHRCAVTWMDDWLDMSLEDALALEVTSKKGIEPVHVSLVPAYPAHALLLPHIRAAAAAAAAAAVPAAAPAPTKTWQQQQQLQLQQQQQQQQLRPRSASSSRMVVSGGGGSGGGGSDIPSSSSLISSSVSFVQVSSPSSSGATSSSHSFGSNSLSPLLRSRL